MKLRTILTYILGCFIAAPAAGMLLGAIAGGVSFGDILLGEWNLEYMLFGASQGAGMSEAISQQLCCRAASPG